MSAPEVSDAALELYAALDPAFTTGDEDRDWTTLHLCAAITAADLDFIHELVTEDEAPGWQILLDPERAPAVALPYLAQFDGARLRPDMSEAQQRAAIKTPEAFARGTLAALEATAERRLTGAQTVLIDERYEGKAWRLRVRTLAAETPDPALTEAEIRAEQKPVGIVLVYVAIEGVDWGDVQIKWATWADVAEDNATWLDLRAQLP